MSGNKKRNVEPEAEHSESDDSEMGDEPHPEAYTGNEEIQVDFEGRNPIDSDFHGIRQMLQQLFLKAHINLSEMADLIIGQNYVGSVVIQSDVDDEESDDEMYESNMLFGITTVLNITHKLETTCLQQLRSYLVEKAEKNATDSTLTYFRDVLGNDSRPVGFLINERFINIPAQISIPLLESLCKEVKRANDKKMPFNFVHYVILIKFYRKEAKKNKPAEDIYSNPEEEIFCKRSAHSFEYSVQAEADSGVTGDWLEGDSSLTPYRKVVLFDAKKLPKIKQN